MTVGYLFLLGSLVGFSLLGILHKVADHPSCRPRMVTMLLLLWAAGLTAAYTLAFDPRGLRMPPSVLGMGAAAGAAASLALFAFQASLRHGKISTSWLVLNLCIAVPILMSILVYREALTAGKGVGISNTRRRLQEMYGAAGSLSLTRASAGGTIVEVRLPLRLGRVATPQLVHA